MKTAAELCRDGRVAADVGCDHAQLACWLARNRSKLVLASDVRDGPLEAARRTVEEQGVTNVKVIKSDGLREIDFADDVIICGMGGELIAEIMSGCRFLNGDTRFILQPMTKADYLRRWLYANGFEIIEERAAFEKPNRAYSIIYAGYTGERRSIDDIFALTGKNTDRDYLLRLAEKLEKNAAGMSASDSFAKQAARLREQAAAILKMAEERE